MIWVATSSHIPKGSRYTLGTRIENKFLDLLEASYTAYFIEKDKRVEKISDCIWFLDIIKFLVSTTWETKLISNKQYELLVMNLEEIGKMLGGWKKSLEVPQKKNPA